MQLKFSGHLGVGIHKPCGSVEILDIFQILFWVLHHNFYIFIYYCFFITRHFYQNTMDGFSSFYTSNFEISVMTINFSHNINKAKFRCGSCHTQGYPLMWVESVMEIIIYLYIFCDSLNIKLFSKNTWNLECGS